MLVQKYFEVRTELVDKALKKYLKPPKEGPKQLYEAMNYAVFNGGKRLRPLMMFSAYEMMKGKNNINSLKPLIPCACAVELVHAASLVHDDLPNMDNSDERRGMPSVHKKYDDATAILVGDSLMTLAFEVLADIKKTDISVHCVRTLAKAISSRGMIGGQAVDIVSAQKKIRINVLRYIHAKKTGALLQATVDMACKMFGADENLTATMGNYALNLGLAYQIIDDILDYFGAYEVLGKEPFEDQKNNKATYPTLIGFEKAKKEAENLLSVSRKLIKNMKNNEVMLEFVNMIQDRLP
ncbi:MAG: geranyl transferase [Candidatus Cloacimonadota bacterium]|nr:MAG: geranyl transferase [Candidatus Cloacimonadota bacterium]